MAVWLALAAGDTGTWRERALRRFRDSARDNVNVKTHLAVRFTDELLVACRRWQPRIVSKNEKLEGALKHAHTRPP